MDGADGGHAKGPGHSGGTGMQKAMALVPGGPLSISVDDTDLDPGLLNLFFCHGLDPFGSLVKPLG